MFFVVKCGVVMRKVCGSAGIIHVDDFAVRVQGPSDDLCFHIFEDVGPIDVAREGDAPHTGSLVVICGYSAYDPAFEAPVWHVKKPAFSLPSSLSSNLTCNEVMAT